MIVTYKGAKCTALPGETVLDCLERHGVDVSSSCRAGVCQSCVLRAVEGEAPALAQQGLSRALSSTNHFLACRAVVTGDLEVAPPGAALASTTARLVDKSKLAPDIVRVRLRCDEPFAYRGGQFVQLVRADGLVRAFSLASLESEDFLELHIRRVRGGAMSAWIHDELGPDDALTVRGPAGECFYSVDDPHKPLLLAGTGTGVAPLWAMARDALARGHTGPIELFHAVRDGASLYLDGALRRLGERFPNLRYTPVVGEDHARLDEIVLSRVPKPCGYRVALAGAPSIVMRLKTRLYIAGAALDEIVSDLFLPGAARES